MITTRLQEILVDFRVTRTRKYVYLSMIYLPLLARKLFLFPKLQPLPCHVTAPQSLVLGSEIQLRLITLTIIIRN